MPAEVLRQAATAGTWVGEGWRMRKGGSRFWAGAVITALHDNGGRLRGFAKVTRDITQQQRDKEQLSRQRQLLETILGQAADAIVACDTDGRMTFVNAAARRLADRDPEDCTLDLAPDYWGEPFATNGQPVPRADWSLSRALRGETTVGREMHLIRANGSTYDILISAAPIIGAMASSGGMTDTPAQENRGRHAVDDGEVARAFQQIPRQKQSVATSPASCTTRSASHDGLKINLSRPPGALDRAAAACGHDGMWMVCSIRCAPFSRRRPSCWMTGLAECCAGVTARRSAPISFFLR
jgi:PAS domain-containing protein